MGISLRIPWVFPIRVSSYRLCRLPIRQPFQKLHHTDQCQPPGSLGGLTTLGKEVGKLLILIDRAERITQLQVDIASGIGGTSNTSGLFRDGTNGLWL